MEPLLAAGMLAGLVVVAMYGVSLIVDQPIESRFGGVELRRAMRPDDRRNPITVVVELVGAAVAPSVLAAAGPERIASWDALLDAAGRPQGLTTSGLAARRGGYTVILGLVTIPFALAGSWWMPLASAAFGFLLPGIALRSEAKERQEEISRALPDFLDVLAVTVSAGLDFRSALARVSDAFEGPLSDEVRKALQQMMLGEARREALDGLRRRNPSESLGEFVTALQQAEDLGAPRTSALAGIAGDVRRGYGQQARREASKVEPRLSVLLTVTLIPAALIIIVVGFYVSSETDLGGLLGG